MGIILLLLRIIFSAMVGNYAEGKGRSFGWGFILSFLISPLLMWIIYAIIGDKKGDDGSIR